MALSSGSLVFDCSIFDANSWPSTFPMNAARFFENKTERKGAGKNKNRREFLQLCRKRHSRSTSLNQCRSRFAIFSSSEIVWTATLCVFPGFIFGYCQLTPFIGRSDLSMCVVIEKAVQAVGLTVSFWPTAPSFLSAGGFWWGILYWRPWKVFFSFLYRARN